jgi:hypothetical protein
MKMAGYKCPFCGIGIPIVDATVRTAMLSFRSLRDVRRAGTMAVTKEPGEKGERAIIVTFYKCPTCNEISVIVTGCSEEISDLRVDIYPRFQCQRYPSYIPAAIRADYEEAFAIMNLSPKASATLSRRCLQGMIRDFWSIEEGNLFAAISELRGKIPDDLWRSIDSLRRLGNIGAHMEKDINLIVEIDPDEARKLVSLIELLMNEWYINQYARQKLFDDILQIDSKKQAQRKLPQASPPVALPPANSPQNPNTV